jgi:hypothetical protein
MSFKFPTYNDYLKDVLQNFNQKREADNESTLTMKELKEHFGDVLKAMYKTAKEVNRSTKLMVNNFEQNYEGE